MKNKLITKIGILFVLITLTSLSVFAAGSIKSTKAQGSAQIENIISDNDQIEFIVTASIDGDADLNGNVVLYDSNDLLVGPFSCLSVPIDSCTIKYPKDAAGRFNSKEQKFTIKLVDDTPQKISLDKKEVTLNVDNSAPLIKRFEIGNTQEIDGKKYSASGLVYLNFDAEDFGFNGETGKCSGMKSVEFYIGANKIADCSGDCIGLNDCKFNGGTKEYKHGGTGEIKVCSKAIDRIGKVSSEKCSTFFIDNEKPKILKETKKIADLNGKLLNNIAPGKTIRAKFSVNVDAPDLDDKSITGDFSELNPDNAELKSINPVSIQVNNAVKTLAWEFDINIKEAGTKKALISMSDKIGNKVENEAIELIFAKDEDGPIVKSIKTEGISSGGISYVKDLGNFIAEIEDATGISEKEVFLHVGEQVFSAKECKGDKPSVCKFEVDLGGFSEGELSIFIGKDSKDILGNAVKDKTEIKAILDRTSPRVKNIENDISITGKSSGQGSIVFGDSMVILALVEDKHQVIATADLSEVILNSAKENIPCEKKGDNNWVCGKQTGAIDVVGQSTERLVRFTFTDVAGNKLDADKKIIVLKSAGQPKETFFRLDIPQEKILPVDASTLETMSQQDYQQLIPFVLVDNKKCNDKPEIINPILKCDEFTKSGIFIGDKIGDSYYGYAEFFITNDDVAGKEYLGIGETKSCIISYNTRCGDTFYKTPEEQKLRVNAYIDWEGVTNVDNVLEEIESIKDEVFREDLWVDRLDKAMTFSQNICNIKQGYGTALRALTLIGISAGACKGSKVADILSGGTCSAIEKGSDTANKDQSKTLEKLNTWINNACGYVKCTGSQATLRKDDPAFGEILKDFKGPHISKFVESNPGLLCDVLREYMLDEIASKTGIEKANLGILYAGSLPSTNLELAKKNLWFAYGCACIPGIIVHAQKSRQIKCEKALCLRDVVPTGLATPGSCEREKAFKTCKEIKGGWNFINAIQEIGLAPLIAFENLLENPIASSWPAIRWAARKGCDVKCESVDKIGIGANACSITKWTLGCAPYYLMVLSEHAAQLAQVRTAIENLGNFQSSIQPDYCEKLNIEPGKKEAEV